MLIVKFAIRESKITWFINDNWIMLISFLLTMVTGISYRRYRKIKNSNKKIKTPNPKGGSFIDECIEPDSIYELVDPPLEIVLKQILNIRQPQNGPIIISVPLLIFSYIVLRQPVKQVSILGVSLFADKVKNLAVKAGIGFVSGSIFFFSPVGIVSLTSALVASAIIFNVALGMGHLECNNLVSKVPMERLSGEKIIGFLETHPEKTPKIFIKGSENTELYVPSKNANDSCSSEYKRFKVKKSARRQPQDRIHRKCEKEYIPLRERTKTLADLKKEDSTENREKAEPYIKRYEDRRRRIMNERVDKKFSWE
jgi:hypothetical protein